VENNTESLEITNAEGFMASKKVLLVDDSVAVRRAVALMLAGSGLACLEAGDGAQALEVLGKEHVDAVLTDLNMPVMNGYQFIEALRKIEAYRFTPVLVLTTECREDVASTLKRSGVTGVLQKPIEKESLIKALRRSGI